MGAAAGAAAAARPEALYGYEAMRLVLDAVAEGGRDREQVIRAALRIRERDSSLGALRIRATGDVENDRFALHSLSDGRFELDRLVP
jgi:ABC-type branched-subunit amino acid transport system substrate-binding protein